MITSTNAIKTLLLASSFAILQPLAIAQSEGKPGSGTMKDSKPVGSTMPGMPMGKDMDMKGMDMKGMGMKGMDMKGMMKGNSEKMLSMSMTGNPDIDFAMMMRMHHQGSVDMAEMELRDGKDSEMKKMAQEIIASQKKEIARFDKFLAGKGHPVGEMTK